jgi:ABC-2 type transport system permease protein
MYTRFYEFSAGVLSVANVIYFVSLCGIILFLAVRVIDKRRWSEG